MPLADGGEGTVEALVKATAGKFITNQVTGPDGSPVQGFYGLLGDRITGVVEVAAASGLNLLPEEKRNPLLTTSLGTGQLIKAALDQGVSKLIIGLGGSATNDGGMGLLSALGVKFLTKGGEILPGRGIDLLHVTEIDIRELDSRLADMEILMACDVTNPFYGPEGAALIYAPQKGADVSTVKKLDEGLVLPAKWNIISIIESKAFKSDFKATKWI
jgi:glycerate kinase